MNSLIEKIRNAVVGDKQPISTPFTGARTTALREQARQQVRRAVNGSALVYVAPEDHLFIGDRERREGGGTAAIVESIRARLVFKLPQEVAAEVSCV